jgi:SAM-dependent methyltransferase
MSAAAKAGLCTLEKQGIEAVSVDASAPLIQAARSTENGSFFLYSYAELIATPTLAGNNFDAVIFNFSLLDDASQPILEAMQQVLDPSGSLIIQTVHPWAVRGNAPYQDEWRTEAFHHFSEETWEPMPWFYRTLGSWISLLRQSGYQALNLHEPVHPDTGAPLSLLFTCTLEK